jgi:hypothetical protein
MRLVIREIGGLVELRWPGFYCCWRFACGCGRSAFNLHPHGVAVAVKLPTADFADKNSEAGAGRVMQGVSV